MAKGLPSQRVGSLGLPVKTPVSSSQQQSSKINSEDLNKSKVKNCSDLKTNEKREIIQFFFFHQKHVDVCYAVIKNEKDKNISNNNLHSSILYYFTTP